MFGCFCVVDDVASAGVNARGGTQRHLQETLHHEVPLSQKVPARDQDSEEHAADRRMFDSDHNQAGITSKTCNDLNIA